MPYLNLDPNYFEHPKTVRLMAWLGETADVFPIRLWAYCAKIHPADGTLKGYSEVEVEAVIKWRGDTGKAVKALMAVGYLKRVPKGFQCVDWKQHEGHLEAFSRRAKAAADARWSKYASSTPKAELSNTPTVPSVPTVPTKPTVPGNGRTVDDSEGRLLKLPWRVRGEHYGRPVQDLSVEYCEWAINGLREIGPEYKLALQCRINQKRGDMTPAQREAHK
jgi:hypothetical protein